MSNRKFQSYRKFYGCYFFKEVAERKGQPGERLPRCEKPAGHHAETSGGLEASAPALRRRSEEDGGSHISKGRFSCYIRQFCKKFCFRNLNGPKSSTSSSAYRRKRISWRATITLWKARRPNPKYSFPSL